MEHKKGLRNTETDENESRRLMIIIKEFCASDMIEAVKKSWGKTVNHINLKRIQANAFEADKKSASARTLQIDFGMNFSCEYQNEVQSALWCRSSVMLFTACAIYKVKCQSFIICSDAKDKTKITIAAFIDFIYNYLRTSNASDVPTEEIIWSDGPTSEFKNKFMIHLLGVLSKKYNIPFHWKYFCTSHGKGIVDGIGGRAKYLVRSAMMNQSNDLVVQSSLDFANVASSLMKKTNVFHISQKEILLLSSNIVKDEEWQNVKPIPGLKEIHVVKYFNNTLSLFKHSLLVPKNDENYDVKSETLSDFSICMVINEKVQDVDMFSPINNDNAEEHVTKCSSKKSQQPTKTKTDSSILHMTSGIFTATRKKNSVPQKSTTVDDKFPTVNYSKPSGSGLCEAK